MTRTLALAFLLALVSLPALADEMTVGFISRLPEIEYTWGSTSPAVEGWPANGSRVTWRANVRAWLAAPREVAYRWRVDGLEVASGNLTIAPNGTTTADLPWTWTFSRHRITFELDTTNAVVEESEKNNSLTVFSDALSVGLWVEQTIYDHHRENQWKLGVGSTTWEDWAQRTIGYYNDMAAIAVYPETPEGVHDRWRIQKIVVVPDESLPLNGLPDEATPGANGNTHPDKNDRTVDLQWGFRAATLGGYGNLTSAKPSNAFYLSTVVLHEIGHARYLADVYAWNVTHNPPNFVIDIRENGTPITGTYLASQNVFRSPEQGLMNSHGTFLDRYSSIVLNQVAGQRATQGNYNEPRNFASFLNDFPAQNRLTILDGDGVPMANADVWVYQSAANAPAWYATHYDDAPDYELQTNASGQVLVGRSPFAPDGQVVHTYGTTNGVAIIRAAKGGTVAYGFLESRAFNLAYWRGETDFADHTVIVGGRNCANTGPSLITPTWDSQTSSLTTLTWGPVSGATEYRVWASTNLGKPRLLATTTARSAEVRLYGQNYWWVEAEVRDCGPRRSETSRFIAPPVRRQRAVRR